MKDLEVNNQIIEAPQVYEAPNIEIVEIEVERGFAQEDPSDGNGGGLGSGSEP
jgi:hypothetical protein